MTSSLDVLGGAQRVAHVVADQLATRGYPVDLVGVSPGRPVHDYGVDPAIRRVTLMPSEWPALPVSLHRSGKRLPPDPDVLARRDRLSAQAAEALGPILAEGDPGVVIVTQLWAMEHLALVPHEEWAVIGQYHSSIEAAVAGGDLDRLLALYPDVDAVAMLTPDDAAAVTRAGLNNATWLPNPLAFWPVEAAADRGDRATTVMYLGRLSPEKGVTYLVDAWGRIADRHPGWRLRIVGSGPEEAGLRRQVSSLAFGGDTVEFAPPVSDAQALLRECDVLVQPSLTEGLPLSLAEAMSLGRACVATDCSAGVRLLTRDGAAARLVARADAGALAEGLAVVLASAAERTRLWVAAREAVSDFRAESVADRWESLIADVLR